MRWRRLVADPAFRRRFRARHHRRPPLLGFFFKGRRGVSFAPTLEPPDRIPHECFSLQLDNIHDWEILCCRHGLVLLLEQTRFQILVWEPLTGDLVRIPVPAGMDHRATKADFSGAVLRSASADGADQSCHFLVVSVRKGEYCTRTIARVYSSESGVWGNLISTDCPSGSSLLGPNTSVGGSSLYLLLRGNPSGLLVLDLDRSCLTVTDVRPDVRPSSFFSRIVALDGGGLGFLHLSEFSIQLWERKTGFDGAARWVVGATIELDKLLSLGSVKQIHPVILGFLENDNVLFAYTQNIVFFMIQLTSLQLKRIPENLDIAFYHAFADLYTAGIQCFVRPTVRNA